MRQSLSLLISLSFCLPLYATTTSSTQVNTNDSAKFYGAIQKIPSNVLAKMNGTTWHQGCPIPLSELVSLKLSYWGFDHKSHIGTLVVDKDVAKDVVSIFKELYKIKFPIRQMIPMYQYAGNDELSMENDNSSSFNCRMATGSQTRYSNHSYGRAIDLNTRENPYVKGNIVLPKNAKAYVKRRHGVPGMITKDSAVVKIFAKHGWTWGGSWNDLQDYQHFEKPLTPKLAHHDPKKSR